MNSGISEEVLEKVLGTADRTNYFLNNLNLKTHPWAILDIILVAILFYWVYLLLKETRAMRILYGIVLLAIVMIAGRLLQLESLNFLLGYVLTALVVAIPVVFQPELRSALERLGRGRFVGDLVHLKKIQLKEIVEQVVSAVDYLAKNKTGAIIVFVRQTGLRDIIQKGTKIDAPVSRELLINIFAPKTPLHDGACIIEGQRIVAANCWLPIGEVELSRDLGSRHRVGVTLSVETDAVVLIVSEEKGMISLAVNGSLTTNLPKGQLKEFLINLLEYKIESISTLKGH